MLRPMQQIRSMVMDNTERFIQWNSCVIAKVGMYTIGGKHEDSIPIRPGCV